MDYVWTRLTSCILLLFVITRCQYMQTLTAFLWVGFTMAFIESAMGWVCLGVLLILRWFDCHGYKEKWTHITVRLTQFRITLGRSSHWSWKAKLRSLIDWFLHSWKLCVQSMQTATANEAWDIFLCDADNVYTLLTKMNRRSRCHLRLRYCADCRVPQWVIGGELRPIQQLTHWTMTRNPVGLRWTFRSTTFSPQTSRPPMTLRPNYFINIIVIDGSVGHNPWPEWSSKFLI